MIFYYPLLIHDDDGYWGEFPDVDGCHAQGDTINEIIEDATLALELHLSEMLKDGEKLNPPSDIKSIKTDKNTFVSIIRADVNLNKGNKSVRKTLTIPSWLNDRAVEMNINFSKTLQEALTRKII